jgi:hypothetical protein
MKTIEKILQQYHSKQSNLELRVGQFFCNNFLDEPWYELYYESDTVKAINKINMWLIDNGYTNKMPKKTQENANETK